MKIHVLFPAHTLPVIEQSHCAFTMKARRFGPMLHAQGYETIAYAVGAPDNPAGWTDAVEVLSPARQEALLGYVPTATGSAFVGNGANVQSDLYREFNASLGRLLESRVEGDDLIACTFGHAHAPALAGRLLRDHAVETGIGYPQCFTGWRIYESHAWMHWHLGKEGRHPYLSEWVVPNDFDPAEWPQRTAPLDQGYVLYFGRIDAIKGLNVVWQLARALPHLEFVLCGQGDPTPWLTEPNIRYEPPRHGMARAELMHGARAVLMPTQYVEPFGGVSVEAMMTGTPCLTSDHSVFTETIPDRWRARTLEDWVAALETATREDPAWIRARALSRWSQPVVGAEYARVFATIPALRRDGFGTAEQYLARRGLSTSDQMAGV